MNVCLL